MKKQYQTYFSLTLWILALILIGSLIGSLTQSEITTWYSTLRRSLLTPPDYAFPIVWTILYALIAISGWILWRTTLFNNLRLIKWLYITQLLLNWSWTPLFFSCHLTGLSLAVLLIMDILVSLIICLSYKKTRAVSLLMAPYLAWIILATYLNFYIWLYN